MIGTCAAHISCNLMVTKQIGRIIIELPLPGKCRSVLNFTVVCLVTWSTTVSEAVGDLALLHTSLLFSFESQLVSIRTT